MLYSPYNIRSRTISKVLTFYGRYVDNFKIISIDTDIDPRRFQTNCENVRTKISGFAEMCWRLESNNLISLGTDF